MSCQGKQVLKFQIWGSGKASLRRWLLNVVSEHVWLSWRRVLALKGFRSINATTYKVHYMKIIFSSPSEAGNWQLR